MARAATDRLKVNPPLGRLPALQYLPPAELQIDAEYQRSIEGGRSQALIRRIAQHWNWDLCQPLVVSRRAGALFVIDGQHRLAAARMRRDIAQLPCVVVEYASAADEAASFVHLNQHRTPLRKPDVFRAAVASGDSQACAILKAVEGAGLRIAPHENYIRWKPGMVANLGGIEASWRRNGPKPTSRALEALGLAWPREVLRYAGTVFPGIAAIAFQYPKAAANEIAAMVRMRAQVDWRAAIMQQRAAQPNLRYAAASAAVLVAAWREFCGEEAQPDQCAARPAPPPPADPANPLPGFIPDQKGMSWCEQCDWRVTRAEAESCKSGFCSMRRAA